MEYERKRGGQKEGEILRGRRQRGERKKGRKDRRIERRIKIRKRAGLTHLAREEEEDMMEEE